MGRVSVICTYRARHNRRFSSTALHVSRAEKERKSVPDSRTVPCVQYNFRLRYLNATWVECRKFQRSINNNKKSVKIPTGLLFNIRVKPCVFNEFKMTQFTPRFLGRT